jgi:hypothetical protein
MKKDERDRLREAAEFSKKIGDEHRLIKVEDLLSLLDRVESLEGPSKPQSPGAPGSAVQEHIFCLRTRPGRGRMGDDRCPTCGQIIIKPRSFRRILPFLEANPNRYVYVTQAGAWALTHGGGFVDPAEVHELRRREVIVPMFPEEASAEMAYCHTPHSNSARPTAAVGDAREVPMTDIAKARETAMEAGRIASMQAAGLAVPSDEAIEVVSRAIIDAFLDAMIKSAEEESRFIELFDARVQSITDDDRRHYAPDAERWLKSFREAQSP